MKKSFKFIDLFAGIGGFHQAMHSVGGDCVFACEWNKYARQTYTANYANISPDIFQIEGLFANDINDVDPNNIPSFDICCAGFPCQPFSMAGHRLGFEDTRGTLFFNIASIVKAKIKAGCPPKVLLLENVKGLKNHHKGETFRIILNTLAELGYKFEYAVLNAKYFGVPQNRERLFIVAWFAEVVNVNHFKFPYGIDKNGDSIFEESKLSSEAMHTKLAEILEPQETIDSTFTISDRAWAGHQRRREHHLEKGNGFSYSLFDSDAPYVNTLVARYWKDGKEILIDQSEYGLNPRKLTPVEAGRLQGYNIQGNGWLLGRGNILSLNIPFNIVTTKKEAYLQFGNSVAIPVVTRIAQEIVNQLLQHD